MSDSGLDQSPHDLPNHREQRLPFLMELCGRKDSQMSRSITIALPADHLKEPQLAHPVPFFLAVE